MFLFYVVSFFKKGDAIQGGTLSKGGHYLRKYGIYVLLTSYVYGSYNLHLNRVLICFKHILASGAVQAIPMSIQHILRTQLYLATYLIKWVTYY